MKKKGRFSTILFLAIMIAGLSLLLYPSFSNYWNSKHASKTISNYAQEVADLGDEEFAVMWQEAVNYNQELQHKKNRYGLSDEEHELYEKTLNIGGSGVMGYIEISSIDVLLPIYHGTSDGVLQVAVGHLDWTSLPVGGKGTHCVLSGHRGLPSAKLFTHLDKLVEGDVFMIRTLDEVLTYEVDQILIVKPEETKALKAVPGEDYCTLVTCTPYGINTHRLLVRGHRIENAEEAVAVHVIAEAVQIVPVLVASFLSVPVLIVVLLIVVFSDRRRNLRKRRPDISYLQKLRN